MLQEKIMPSDYIYQSCKHICLYDHHSSGADPGFQVRWGAHLKKLRRVEGCAKIFGVFRVKNHDFTPKNHFFPILGGRAPGAPPRSAPVVRSMYNFVNCLQFNIRYETVERPAPVGGALVYINTDV